MKDLTASEERRVAAEGRMEALKAQTKIAREGEQAARSEIDSLREQTRCQQQLATQLQQLQVLTQHRGWVTRDPLFNFLNSVKEL